MAKSYLFLKPAYLPILAETIGETLVLPSEPAEVTRFLQEVFPSLQWTASTQVSGEIDEGWVGFSLQPEEDGGALSMRCSLRADYSQSVQRICDRSGWAAFDEEARCFRNPFRSDAASRCNLTQA